MLEFGIVKVMGVVFTPEFNIANSMRIANVVCDLTGDRLDGEPTMLPIPPDAPAEIPRVTLSSSDRQASVSISPARTNFEFKVSDAATQSIDDHQSCCSDFSAFFSQYAQTLDLKVQRVALVTERLRVEDDVVSYVLDRFCKDSQTKAGRPFHNANRFEIHSLKNYEWDDFQMNSWVRMKCFPIQLEGQGKAPALLVENDLNTLSSEEDPGADFAANDITKFFDGIPDHLEQILKLYFAEE